MLSFKLQQEKIIRNPTLMVQATVTVLLSMRNIPLTTKSVSSTPKTLQPNDMPLAHSFTLLLFFQPFCPRLSIPVFTQAWAFLSPLFSPPPSKSSNLTKPSLMAAERQLCTPLCGACFSCLTRVQCLHSPHVPPVLFQPAIMCARVAQREAELFQYHLPFI